MFHDSRFNFLFKARHVEAWVLLTCTTFLAPASSSALFSLRFWLSSFFNFVFCGVLILSDIVFFAFQVSQGL